jgi:hypothetical protein
MLPVWLSSLLPKNPHVLSLRRHTSSLFIETGGSQTEPTKFCGSRETHSAKKVHSMALDFIKQMHRDSLEKAWNARPAKVPKDPMPKRRQNVLNRIDGALAQLESGEANPSRGIYRSRDHFKGVRVQLKYGRRALRIDGRDHWFVEDAATFFRSARAAVESGELDDAINGALKSRSKGKRNLPARKSKPPEPGRVDSHTVAPDAEVTAPDRPAAKPGRYAQKHEKLLAAGILSAPAL